MNKTTHDMNKFLRSRMMKRSLLLAAALLMAVLPGRTQQYVFLYKNGNTYNFLYRNGNNIGNTTTFNASSCVWTGSGTSSSTFINGTGTNA